MTVNSIKTNRCSPCVECLKHVGTFIACYYALCLIFGSTLMVLVPLIAFLRG